MLEKARTSSIEKKIILNQMRWLGHVVRMEDDRLPKQLFYGEVIIGKRPQHKPKKRFKDVVKNNLKALGIDVNNWETLAANRAHWRQAVKAGCDLFEQKRIEHALLKRTLQKQDVNRFTRRVEMWNLFASFSFKSGLDKSS